MSHAFRSTFGHDDNGEFRGPFGIDKREQRRHHNRAVKRVGRFELFFFVWTSTALAVIRENLLRAARMAMKGLVKGSGNVSLHVGSSLDGSLKRSRCCCAVAQLSLDKGQAARNIGPAASGSASSPGRQ